MGPEWDHSSLVGTREGPEISNEGGVYFLSGHSLRIQKQLGPMGVINPRSYT